ncbi:MAG: trigger factor [Anaerolineae bacterium]
MNITEQGVENHQTVLVVEVEPERVERAKQQAARRISQRYRIPGFRPGKAPYSHVVRVFGEEQVLEAAIDDMGPQVYKEAIEQQKLEPFAPGEVKLLSHEPLTFQLLVPLPPTVDPGDYRSVKIEATLPEVTDDDVEDQIERLQQQQATWTPVERPAQLEDMVTADVEGETDGERIIETYGDEFVLKEESFREFPPAFVDEIIGMSDGETREFSLTFPDDFEREALREKTASFKVTLHAVKEQNLPELDDAFAQGVSEEFQTLDDLEHRIRQNLEFQASREGREKVENDVLDAVLAQAVVSFPPILLQQQIEEEMERQEKTLERMGFSLDNFLRMTNRTPEDLRAELAPELERRIARTLLLDDIARRENIEPPADFPAEQRGNGRLRATLDWLVETIAGVGPGWPADQMESLAAPEDEEVEDAEDSAVEAPVASAADDEAAADETPVEAGRPAAE